jgi:hypothetical protein
MGFGSIEGQNGNFRRFWEISKMIGVLGGSWHKK